jgi:hypothetical protein
MLDGSWRRPRDIGSGERSGSPPAVDVDGSLEPGGCQQVLEPGVGRCGNHVEMRGTRYGSENDGARAGRTCAPETTWVGECGSG